MIERVRATVLRISRWVIRGLPFIVAFCILLFPAYKGIWAGYLPVVFGVAAAWWAIGRVDRIAHRISGYSTNTLNVVFYLMPAAIQAGLIISFQPQPWFDGLFVFQHAAHLVATGTMDPMTYYPPAQTWWYAGWFGIFGVSPLVAQISQIPLSMGVTWTTRRLARDVGSESSSRVAALVVAWYPTFIGYVLTTPYYHYLYTLMMVLMVWALYRFWILDFACPARRFWNGGVMVFAGVAAGVGALTKAVQLIAPLQVVTWLVVMACGMAVAWRKWVVGVMLFGAGMIAVLGPWVARNYAIFDELVPVCTSGGLVLYSANNPDSNGLYSGIPDDVDLESPKDILAHSRRCADLAKQFMRENPGQFFGMATRKFLHTWGVEATFTELINVRGQVYSWIKPGFSFACLFGWTFMAATWVAGAWRLGNRRAGLTAYEILFGVVILSNAVVYLFFEGGDRHHLPLVPLIAVLVAVNFVNDKAK